MLVGGVFSAAAVVSAFSGFGPVFDPASAMNSFVTFVVLGLVGFFCMAPGMVMLRLGLMRPVSTYVATEASPALEIGARAVGRGLREELRGPFPPDIRVKCRVCGFLDSEDAKYCSKCGSAL